MLTAGDVLAKTLAKSQIVTFWRQKNGFGCFFFLLTAVDAFRASLIDIEVVKSVFLILFYFILFVRFNLLTIWKPSELVCIWFSIRSIKKKKANFFLLISMVGILICLTSILVLITDGHSISC